MSTAAPSLYPSPKVAAGHPLLAFLNPLRSSGAGLLSYTPPTVTAISGVGASLADTRGGQPVLLAGTSFGPLTPVATNGTALGPALPAAVYGRPLSGLPFAASSCKVTVADIQMQCLTAPGSGAGLVWAAVLGGQASAPSTATTSYRPPSIAGYTGPGSIDADTRGGQGA